MNEPISRLPFALCLCLHEEAIGSGPTTVARGYAMKCWSPLESIGPIAAKWNLPTLFEDRRVDSRITFPYPQCRAVVGLGPCQHHCRWRHCPPLLGVADPFVWDTFPLPTVMQNCHRLTQELLSFPHTSDALSSLGIDQKLDATS